MYVNDYVARQIARDKEAELLQFMQAGPTAPRKRPGGWLVGFLVAALAGAGYFLW